MNYIFKSYFRFSGRIPRSIYFLSAIPIIILAIVAQIYEEQNWSIFLILAIIWPSLAISTKRWHDRDKSGWWNLINLIPLIGTTWSFVECGFLSGTNGPNRFGEDPLHNKEN
jgi:uncharacterized membrane protein YhaH (DUF805 family)